MRTLITAAWSEATWWIRSGLRLVRNIPGHVAVMCAVIWLTVPMAPWWVPPVAVTQVATIRLCAILWPLGFHRVITGPLQRSWRRRWFRRNWRTVAETCGLGMAATGIHRVGQPGVPGCTAIPGLLRTSAEGPRVTLRLRPRMGQTLDDFERAGERLRIAVGSTRVRVEPFGASEVLVKFTVGDSLATPFEAEAPDTRTAVVTDRVLLGQVEDGSRWWLPVGPHTLVAGCSGAGKGSLFWSFAFGLAPGVRAGVVQLHGVDLKGGMEILMGAELFTMRATNAAEAVVLLESLVEQLRKRTTAYAGHVRSHVPTVNQPLHVVMIDELAALTAYCPERDIQRRAELAINLLCSQGRAPGFMVFACLQDPRKDVIPNRGLFTQMVGLRLKDISETAMVLGESAVNSGAHCHRITPRTPGMGYVVPEDGGYPIRVRAGFASDRVIRSVATSFATPTRQPVDVPTDFHRDPLGSTRRLAAPREKGAAR